MRSTALALFMAILLYTLAQVPVAASPKVAGFVQEAVVHLVAGKAQGSGVHDGAGRIWTVAHLFDDETKEATATTLCGEEFLVELQHIDRDKDIAVVQARKLPKCRLAAIKWHCCPPRVGERIYSVGCPGGKIGGRNIVSAGIIGRVGLREGEGEWDMTDAAGAPGSSGGGIFSRRNGRCWGLVSQIQRHGTLFYCIPTRVIRVWARARDLPFD